MEGEHDELDAGRAALAAGAHRLAAARAVAVVGAAVVRRADARQPLPDPPGKDWWEDGAQVEALAALAAWVGRYDSGEWDDPPGKLALLYDLERVRELIRGARAVSPRSRPRWLRAVPDRLGLPAATGRPTRVRASMTSSSGVRVPCGG